jgi:hypothetical protein
VSGVCVVSMRGIASRVRVVLMRAVGSGVALLVIHATPGDALSIVET